MRRVALIRRRDGEVVPFDEGSVVDAVHRALQASGREDRLLASEIASVVTLFLEKTYYDLVPTVEQVEDMVEKVLLETGHASAAKAFILHRARESRLREAQSVRAAPPEPTLFEAGAIIVDDTARGVSAPFSREALARLISADGTVTRAQGDQAAAATESRLRRLGVTRVAGTWVRALAEVELLSQGVPVDLRRRPGVLLDSDTIAASYHARAVADQPPLPWSSSRDLGGLAMRAHALGDILPAEVAFAHLDGEIHIHGLDQPAALHSVSFSPDDVRRGVVPGSSPRAEKDSAYSMRRLSASLGRGARIVSGAAGTTSLVGVAGACGRLSADCDKDALSEEAWHLLFETSVDGADSPGGRIELDLTPLADAAAEGVTADADADADTDADRLAAAFSAAALRVLARGAGLPPRGTLPVPVIGVSERVLSSESGREVLRLAAEAALRGERVCFAMLRADADPRRHSGLLPIGSSCARAGFQGAPRAAVPAEGASVPASFCAGRVTLNLVRAARLAGRHRMEPFLRNCDRLIDLATSAHRARREFIAQGVAAPGGSLAPLFRGPRGRDGLLQLGTAPWSIAITGLSEALLHLTGFEAHEGDETVTRSAARIVSYLSLKVREAGLSKDMVLTLDADDDRAVARRFFHMDLRSDAERTASNLAAPGYTAGVGCRESAPIDVLLRLEREEPLHAHLATATLRVPLPAADAGGPDGVVALLGKCLRAGRAVQVEVATW